MIDAARALRDAIVDEIDVHESAIANLRMALDVVEPLAEQPATMAQPVPVAGADALASEGEPEEARASAPPIQSPGSDRSGVGSAGPEASSTPVSTTVACPQCGTEVKAQGLGSHMRKHKPGYSEPVREPRLVEGYERLPGGRIRCPQCGDAIRPNGLGPHRRGRRHTEAINAKARAVATASPQQRGGQVISERARPQQERDFAARTAGKLDCDECGRGPFGSAQALGTHRDLMHPVDDSKPHVAPPPHVPAHESWVCNRCPEEFPTRALRDAHQATHPPIPDHGGPVGANRDGARRVPSAVQLA